MTFAANDMTCLINDMNLCHHVDEQKMSCYDKNASGYVKVKLIADPLTLTALPGQ